VWRVRIERLNIRRICQEIGEKAGGVRNPGERKTLRFHWQHSWLLQTATPYWTDECITSQRKMQQPGRRAFLKMPLDHLAMQDNESIGSGSV
jgi:hypothetical protein